MNEFREKRGMFTISEKAMRMASQNGEEALQMAEDKHKDPEYQEKRIKEHLKDPDKNKQAWNQKAQDASGRDWTKPRRPQLKDGEV